MSNIIQIPLDKGMFALIDSEDYSLISEYRWYARRGKNGVYYATSKNHKNIHMHRLILSAEPHVMVDHKNHNGLDNTRGNIRIATYVQNNCNKRSYSNVSSKFKGVYWNKEKMKWTSQITNPGSKTKHVGHFDSELDAALAYNNKAIELHGEFACLNIV